MQKHTLLPPSSLAQADASWLTSTSTSTSTSDSCSLTPTLSHLLLLPTTSPILQRLSRETLNALLELERSERPDTYEGLLDVARYCVDEEPGWSAQDKWELIRQGTDVANEDAGMAAQRQLEKLEEEMWDAAGGRSKELVKLARDGVTVDAIPSRSINSSGINSSSSSKTSTRDASNTFDNDPLISLADFTKLISQSDILSHFFAQDLPGSMRLEAAVRVQETPREALATLAAVAVTGGGGGSSTAKRVRGLLGGLLGEVGDRVGKATGRETRIGPKSSFVGLQNDASKTELDRLERGFADAQNGRGAGNVRIAKGAKSSAAAAAQSRRPRTPTGATPALASEAEERVKAAAAALVSREEGAFIIDEARDGEGEEDEEAATAGELEDELQLVPGTTKAGVEESKKKKEEDKATIAQKRMADDLRNAPAQ